MSKNATRGTMLPVSLPQTTTGVSGATKKGLKTLPKTYDLGIAPKPIMPKITAAPKLSKAARDATDWYRQEKRLLAEDEHQEALIRQSGGIAPPTLSVVRKVFATNLPSEQQVRTTGLNAPPPNYPDFQRSSGRGNLSQAWNTGSAWFGGSGGIFGQGVRAEPRSSGTATDVITRNPLNGNIVITDTGNVAHTAHNITSGSSSTSHEDPLPVPQPIPQPRLPPVEPQFAPPVVGPALPGTVLAPTQNRPLQGIPPPAVQVPVQQIIQPAATAQGEVSSSRVHRVRSNMGGASRRKPYTRPRALAVAEDVYGINVPSTSNTRAVPPPPSATAMQDLPQVAVQARDRPQVVSDSLVPYQAPIVRKRPATGTGEVPHINRRRLVSNEVLDPYVPAPLGAPTSQKRKQPPTLRKDAVDKKRVILNEVLEPYVPAPLGAPTSVKRKLGDTLRKDLKDKKRMISNEVLEPYEAYRTSQKRKQPDTLRKDVANKRARVATSTEPSRLPLEVGLRPRGTIVEVDVPSRPTKKDKGKGPATSAPSVVVNPINAPSNMETVLDPVGSSTGRRRRGGGAVMPLSAVATEPIASRTRSKKKK